jgi:hypothetical protein
MRILGTLILSSAWLLASCASGPFAQQQQPVGSCESATVPSGAMYGTREGMDIATYPPKLASGHTGCQRVWYGERQRPEAMQVLATYQFDSGRVSRLTGRVPGGAAYDCHYREGALDTGRSQNAAQCPKASELQRAD